MRVMPDGCVDAVFADPLYESPGPWLEQVFRVAAGPIVIAPGQENIRAYPQEDWMLAWHKPNSQVRCKGGMLSCWGPLLLYRYKAAHFFHDVLRGDIGRDGIDWHPWPKPEGLLSRIVDRIAGVGGLVFDPFLGSGTTAVVCERLGRRWIGAEINPEYAAMAEKRIARQREQLTLEGSGFVVEEAPGG
jgi:hypothetical protein